MVLLVPQSSANCSNLGQAGGRGRRLEARGKPKHDCAYVVYGLTSLNYL